MFIAREKKQSNIAEYLIYMWQIEDLIRSCNFDLELIQKTVIANFAYPEEQKEALSDWYALLIKKMKDQEIEKVGHLKDLNAIVNDLMYLHASLINTFKDEFYIKLYDKARPNIEELRKKSTGEFHEVEICFNGVYGYLMLKLKKANIADQTTKAVESLTQLLAYLSEKYKEFKGLPSSSAS